MTDTPIWVAFARNYIGCVEQGPGDAEKARDQAIQTCPEADVRSILRDPKNWMPAVQRLYGAGRTSEAGTVELLGLRPVANQLAAIYFEGLEEQQRVRAFEDCKRAMTVSAALRFPECEAHFGVMLGLRAIRDKYFAPAASLLQRCLALQKELAGSNPAAYEYRVAQTLENLAIALSEQKQFRAAAGYLEDALVIWRRLAVQQPDYYLAAIARASINLGIVRRLGWELTSSRDALDEALAFYTNLPPAQAVSHQAGFAQALSEMSSTQRALRDLPAARGFIERALDLYRGLARAEPRLYGPRVAMCCSNLGAVLWSQGDLRGAETATVEARRTFELLAAEQPGFESPELASTLCQYGAILVNQKRAADAREPLERAVVIFRRFAELQPEVFRSEVASALAWVGQAREDLSDLPGAERALQETVDIGRELASRDGSHKPALGGYLNNLAGLLWKQGDRTRCNALTREAVELVESDPDPKSLWLSKAHSPGAHINWLAAVSTSADADRVFRALAALREGSVRALGQTREESLASACESLGCVDRRAGRHVCIVAAQQLSSAPKQEESMLLATLDASSFHYENSRSFTAAADALFGELESVFREPRPSGAQWKARMAELGSAAWEALPQTVRDILHPRSTIDVLISGDSYWTAFPWEALRFGSGEDDYLGWSRHLTRWSALTAAGTSVLAVTPSRDPEQNVAIVCPWDADPRQLLKGSRDEAQALARDLPLRGYALTEGSLIAGAGATQDSIETALNARPAFFHYTGHGGIVREEETLLLHGGTFGSSEIRALQQKNGWADGVFARGALIVLNCCFTGRIRMYGGRREDLTGVFLEQGAGGVIASALPVYDPVGQVLGTAIYALPASTGIGPIVATIRKMIGTLSAAANSPFYPTWSMIQYHGDPWLAMPSAPASHGGAPMPGLIEAVTSWLRVSPERAAATIAEFMR